MASDPRVIERLKTALADRYRIEREIGSGGMATVYLAQDFKHDRRVAVKVLKPELAAIVGTERFLAEIRTTANLSHPHILPLHDSGEADGFLFYVMPYVEGESLRQKLDRDGQLPVEEAVRIAGGVADALDSAHRHGVIHRDLKPGNILFQEGEPVIADFGVALAVSAAGEKRLTETGVSVGTPYYMSPEQAAGDRTPTAASDVYSLGCVIYEMLTGETPHKGSSARAILGKILLADVTRPTKLRRTIPANVESAVLKALERLPADRFESASELVAALRDKTFRHGIGVGVAARPWKSLAISFGAVALLAMAVAVSSLRAPGPSGSEVSRHRIHPPGDGPVPEWARYFALAPDGSSMVYRDSVGLESGRQLWVKDRESAEGRPLSGTTGARDVVYSPDGQWIAFTVGTDFIKRPLQGAGTVTLLEGMDDAVVGPSWMADGTILCEQEGNTLVRIDQDSGAIPDTVFNFSPDLLIRVHGLPGEKAALAVACVNGACVNGTVLYAVDLQADTAWVVLDEVLNAWYVATGYVVWVRRDGAVFATSFDLDRMRIGDFHQPLFEGVRVSRNTADMEMGKDGTVIFLQGTPPGSNWEPVWVDRAGREEPMETDLSGDLYAPTLSPDGQLLAVDLAVEGGREVWISDLRRGSKDKLTVEGLGSRASWSPDGSSVIFNSLPGGNRDVWEKRADGSAEAKLLIDYDRDLADAVWSPRGAWVVARTATAEDGLGDILAWPMDTDAEPVPLVATEDRELTPALSPNGRFLAYTSNRSGLNQVYVRPFPNVNLRRWQISVTRGIEPVWSTDGRELFYRRGPGGDLMAVRVETESAFRLGEERVLFRAGRFRTSFLRPQYDVRPDGQRFVMLRRVGVADGDTDPPMIMIQNFFTELEEKLGEGR